MPKKLKMHIIIIILPLLVTGNLLTFYLSFFQQVSFNALLNHMLHASIKSP